VHLSHHCTCGSRIQRFVKLQGYLPVIVEQGFIPSFSQPLQGNQVYVDEVLVAFVDVLLGLQHSLPGISARPETVALGFEVQLKERGDGLVNGLLEQAVGYGGNA
jgi:hypothetical protein